MFLLAPHLLFLLSIIGMHLVTQSPAFTAVTVAAFLVGVFISNRLGLHMNRTMETILAVLFLIGLTALSLGSGEHYIAALRRWLVLILVFRAFRRMEKRDYILCFLITGALFIHIGSSYSDLPFLFLTLAFLALLPYALFYFLAYYGGFQKTGRVEMPARLRFSWGQFRYMTTISLLLIAITIVLFVIIPRPGGSTLLGSALEEQNRATGFPDSVPLGSFNQVTEQQNIIMVVQTDSPQLWRGTVLDCYIDGVWRETGKQRYGRRGGATPSFDTGRPTTTRRFELFDVKLTDYQLFSSGQIVSAREVDRLWAVWINDYYSTLFIFGSRASRYHGTYEVVSIDTEYVGPTEIPERYWRLPIPGRRYMLEEKLLLQVPEDLPQSVRNLALSLTKGKKTTEEKARAVEQYLLDGYTYSTANLNSGDRNPIEYFLFESKSGHCEYFATSFTILLRCAGVKARVVQGFAPGTYIDGQYVVRMSDAHLWSEVFYEGRGWKAYDPTPGREERIMTRRPMSLMARMRLQWHTYVLQYDGAAQAALFEEARIRAAAFLQSVAIWARRYRSTIATVAALFASLVLVLWLRRRFRRPSWVLIRATHRRSRSMRVRNYFGRYLKEIARRGYRRSPGTTPNDLIAALARDGAPVVDDARILTAQFYDTRFGGQDLNADQEAQTRLAITRIRRWAR
jgi:hypothetical protein